MPSKNYNGNNPLGRKRIKTNGLNTNGALARLETELGRLQPSLSLQTGSQQLPNGRVQVPRKARRGGGTTEPCILGYVSIDAENSDEEGTKYKINAGFLSGGGSTETIEPDDIAATINDYVYISVAWTASTVNGVLQAGGTMGEVTTAQGSTVPDDTIPTASTPEGTANIVLGRWLTNGAEEPLPVWTNQGCGSIQMYFCPGNGFFYGRANEVQTFL